MILAFFGRLLAPIAGKLLAWGTIIVAVLGALALVRKSGRDAERAERGADTLRDVEKAKDVERKIDALPDGAAAERLRDKWSRD